MTPLEADHAAREASLSPERSILLQAPAGSGKTEVLTQRFLRLLAVVDEPEEILAITFTRKAAAEMRRRVLGILDGAIDPARPTAARLHELRTAALARASARGWDPDELRTRLRIQTIDSLNHEIARSMPVLGRGPAALEVTDDAEALHREAARVTLREAEADPALQPSLDLVLRRLDNNLARAETLLASLLARRAQWLPSILQHAPEALAPAVERSLESIAADALLRLQRALPARLRAVAEQLLRAAASRLQAMDVVEGAHAWWGPWLSPDAALVAEARQLAAWQGLAALLLTASTGEWRKALTRTHGFPPQEPDDKAAAMALIEECSGIEGLRAALLGLQALPPPRLHAAEHEALAALARLLQLSAGVLRLVFDAAGRVDHTEVAAVARQGLVSLGAPSELALRRAAALKHLLVDEFQDTSVEQLQLLETLVAGWAGEPGHSLFVVGDPMQSIYQFRSAEVGLFLRAREHGVGELPLEPLNLTRNFRATPALIRWCNDAFTSVFPPRDDVRESAVSFLAAEPGLTSVDAPAPHVSVTPLEEPDADHEAEALARTVMEARARHPRCSIAVLVQASSHAPPIIRALRRAGVPVRGVDLEPLSRQPAVRDIVSLGSALLHAGDRIAWLASLRAPWCGLTLADLLALVDGAPLDAPVPALLQEPERVARLSTDGRARLARCAPLMLEAFAQRGRGPFMPALRELWERLGGAAALGEQTEWHHVQAWLSALGAREGEGARLDGALLRELAEGIRAGTEGESQGAVEVLTIHRAKGLEWDVVLLPGLHRPLRGDDRPLLSWIELPRPDRSVDLLVAALSIGGSAEDDRLAQYIALLRRQRQRHERCRLAYVAATRARRELHLFAHAPPGRDGRPKLRGSSMLQTFWPAVAGHFPDAPPADAREAGGQGPVTAELPLVHPALPPQPVLSRLPADWQPMAEEPMPALPRLSATAEIPSELRPQFLWVGTARRAIGTVVHAELERLAASGDVAPDIGAEAGARRDAAVARAAAWRLRLRELGVDEAEVPRALDSIARILEAVGRDERARWILSPTHAEAASELRLSGIVDGQLRDIVIDRSFVDAEGTRWVIDYKTGTHEGADLERFLAEESERYRPQLALYRRLAAALGPQPVRTALYFPLLGRFVELTP